MRFLLPAIVAVSLLLETTYAVLALHNAGWSGLMKRQSDTDIGSSGEVPTTGGDNPTTIEPDPTTVGGEEPNDTDVYSPIRNACPQESCRLLVENLKRTGTCSTWDPIPASMQCYIDCFPDDLARAQTTIGPALRMYTDACSPSGICVYAGLLAGGYEGLSSACSDVPYFGFTGVKPCPETTVYNGTDGSKPSACAQSGEPANSAFCASTCGTVATYLASDNPCHEEVFDAQKVCYACNYRGAKGIYVSPSEPTAFRTALTSIKINVKTGQPLPSTGGTNENSGGGTNENGGGSTPSTPSSGGDEDGAQTPSSPSTRSSSTTSAVRLTPTTVTSTLPNGDVALSTSFLRPSAVVGSVWGGDAGRVGATGFASATPTATGGGEKCIAGWKEVVTVLALGIAVVMAVCL
ncbi:hypothetical protein JCM8547_000697 [Rhodosporidiobolus lusitaniae]